MACDPVNFSNVTQAAFDCCKATAMKYGVTIAGNSGSGSNHGFTVAWNYDSAARTLKLQCTKKPFFIGCGGVNDHLTEAVQKCISANP